ncbi:hypothetical protein BBUCA112A_KI0065 (plasmid) [Borreliella burgdorferi CA-11.2A]|nr:hypothetical protein BBU72A_I0026 [Borreliella burgdorferi 72a]ACN56152.1 hypothetical protein BBUCA112A_KI0065 [Borreliella burgdorferi CA-11.2A]ACN92074.1 hypothetical protein BBU94A_I24 [Borreliella burgdorferi 94a]
MPIFLIVSYSCILINSTALNHKLFKSLLLNIYKFTLNALFLLKYF